MLALDDLPDLLVHSFSLCRIIAGASPVQPTTPTAICTQHELSEQASPNLGLRDHSCIAELWVRTCSGRKVHVEMSPAARLYSRRNSLRAGLNSLAVGG
jgi:hypothetical protein